MKIFFAGGLFAGLSLCAAAPRLLTLDQAQTLLFSGSPELRSENFSEEKTRAQLSEARAAYLPSLDVYGSYQAFTEANHLHVEFPPPVGTVDRTLGDKDREEYGVDLSIPLYAGGQRRGQVLSKEAAVKASAETVRARRNQLSLRLVSLYYAWQMADAARATQQGIVAAHEDAWHRAQAEVKQGASLASREASARARWFAAQADLQSAVDTRDSLARAASLLLGLQPGDEVTFPVDTAAVARATGDTTPAAFQATERTTENATRPEIAALDRTSESLEFQERALTGQRLPTVSAMAGYRLANPGLNLGSDDYMSYGLVGLQVRWNLFDGFRSRSQRLQVRSQLEAVAVERERQTAFWSEAAQSADRYAARLDLSLRAAQAALEAAQQGLREKTAQRKQGTASDLDVIDATVLEAKSTLLVKQLALQIRLAEWQKRFARGETLVFSQGE